MLAIIKGTGRGKWRGHQIAALLQRVSNVIVVVLLSCALTVRSICLFFCVVFFSVLCIAYIVLAMIEDLHSTVCLSLKMLEGIDQSRFLQSSRRVNLYPRSPCSNSSIHPCTSSTNLLSAPGFSSTLHLSLHLIDIDH
jgi:hypothetical protein